MVRIAGEGAVNHTKKAWLFSLSIYLFENKKKDDLDTQCQIGRGLSI